MAATEMTGQRISWGRGDRIRHGRIAGQGRALDATFYIVRIDASGLIVNVLPQWIVAR